MSSKTLKYILCIPLLLLILRNFACSQHTSKQHAEKIDTLVTFALSLKGIPYRYAGTSPEEGFDCSGFVHYVFKHHDIDVPRMSKAFATVGSPVEKEDAQKGDIILFTGSDPQKRTIGHVGIIISEKNETLEFVHASSYKNRKGIVTNLLNTGKYEERFVTIRRLTF